MKTQVSQDVCKAFFCQYETILHAECDTRAPGAPSANGEHRAVQPNSLTVTTARWMVYCTHTCLHSTTPDSAYGNISGLKLT